MLSMSRYSERLQVLIDPRRRERLDVLARERHTSVADLVREAIDLAFPEDLSLRRRAAHTILESDLIEVPEPEQLRRELEELRSGDW
jgi:predicted DNA-binding protein